MASLSELFTNIANAIRAKTGSSDPIVATDFPEAISNISGAIHGQVSASNRSVDISVPIDFTTVSCILLVPEYIRSSSSYTYVAFPETSIECSLVEGDSITVAFNQMGQYDNLSDVEIFHDGSVLTFENRASNVYFYGTYNYVIIGS